jgi:hypothetical protein
MKENQVFTCVFIMKMSLFKSKNYQFSTSIFLKKQTGKVTSFIVTTILWLMKDISGCFGLIIVTTNYIIYIYRRIISIKGIYGFVGCFAFIINPTIWSCYIKGNLSFFVIEKNMLILRIKLLNTFQR